MGRDIERRANDLYWESEQSVNQIADDLDLSKSALYELVRPLPTALACPSCGAELVYDNRTARRRGQLTCRVCAWEGTEEESVEVGGGEDQGASGGVGAGAGAASGASGLWGHRDAGVGRVLAGGALLGAAVGLMIVRWNRKD